MDTIPPRRPRVTLSLAPTTTPPPLVAAETGRRRHARAEQLRNTLLDGGGSQGTTTMYGTFSYYIDRLQMLCPVADGRLSATPPHR